MKTMKIGIMSWEDHKKQMLAIAMGKYKPKRSDPKVWFESMDSLAQVLGDDNQRLLRLIDEHKPQSLAELAEMSGRSPPNLSRTLKTLERYDIVGLKQKAGKLVPTANATKFTVELGMHHKTQVRGKENEWTWSKIGAELFSSHIVMKTNAQKMTSVSVGGGLSYPIPESIFEESQHV